jgi:hypothetical protein
MTDYSDCRAILERALAAPNGLRVSFATIAEATRFRMRCNQARKEDRKASREIHKPGEPGWNRSQFDGLVLRLPKDSTTVVFEFERPVEMLKVEEF